MAQVQEVLAQLHGGAKTGDAGFLGRVKRFLSCCRTRQRTGTPPGSTTDIGMENNSSTSKRRVVDDGIAQIPGAYCLGKLLRQ